MRPPYCNHQQQVLVGGAVVVGIRFWPLFLSLTPQSSLVFFYLPWGFPVAIGLGGRLGPLAAL